jgi:fatty acid desaturase
VILSSFLGTTFEAISTQHFEHHKNFGSLEDPGASDYYVRFSSKKDFIFFIISPIFGYIFFKKIKQYIQKIFKTHDLEINGTNISHPSPHLLIKKYIPIVLIQFFIFYVITSGFTLNELWKYPVFVFLPLITLFLFLNRLRMFLEHGSLNYTVCDYLVQKKPTTRTIYASFVERILFCGSDFNYHHEHHLYPGVPGYKLPQLHQELLKFKFDEDFVRNTYAQSFREIWSYLDKNNTNSIAL